LPFWERGHAFAVGHQLLFDGARAPGASVGGARIFVAIGFTIILGVAAARVRGAPLERVVAAAALVMLAFVVLFPWRWPWYALSPLATFSLNHRRRAELMLFGVAVLWAATLALRYTFVHAPY
jgi:hypothetical protein